MRYSEATYQTKRWKTRPVQVGTVGIGGDNPIRIQSMTTSDTSDVDATVAQIIRLADEGCELARVTVQGKKEALACERIKNHLIQKGYMIPLIADIHFYPKAALLVAESVDKVRINPGNFADRRASLIKAEWDERSYAEGREKIETLFVPLIQKCKTLKKALRIGVNHGSLSDRIMNRYGDTPRGMVESALEFAAICRAYHFHEFVFSMKSSHPLVMIEAYRLLVFEMMKRGWNYPLHVGVTEAGSGQEGRVKSAIGIGSLLVDGLGDTIRVSLTEDPWEELDTCRRLVSLATYWGQKKRAPFIEKMKRGSKGIERRFVRKTAQLHRQGSVFVTLNLSDLMRETLLEELGVEGEGNPCPKRVDGVYIPGLTENHTRDIATLKKAGIAVLTDRFGVDGTLPISSLHSLGISPKPCAVSIQGGDPSTWKEVLRHQAHFILLELSHSIVHEGRIFFDWLLETKLDLPVILVGNYREAKGELLVRAASEIGSLLSDGYGEGILLKTSLGIEKSRLLALQILQGCRLRASQTEFISCPGCGRTRFDLQETTERIRKQTAHLPGVKIAIMGCIVNGPGEMADADFGYVGSGFGKVDLYVGKKCVEKGIESHLADKRLIDLIKAAGYWVDPPVTTESPVK